MNIEPLTAEKITAADATGYLRAISRENRFVSFDTLAAIANTIESLQSSLDLTQAALGVATETIKELRARLESPPCESCDGSGEQLSKYQEATTVNCMSCRGSGKSSPPPKSSRSFDYSKACALLARYHVAATDREVLGDLYQEQYMAALKACTDAMNVQPAHLCRRATYCICSIGALEPDDNCPQHGAGEWPPRCEICGKFLSAAPPAEQAQAELPEELFDSHAVWMKAGNVQSQDVARVLDAVVVLIRARLDATKGDVRP